MPRGKHDKHVRGDRHPRWNGGRTITEHGYVRVQVGKDHPLADPNGYAYEHAVVASARLGRFLGPDELVHHLNGNRQDNRPENLRVETRNQHNEHHAGGPRDAITGRFTSRGGPTPKSGGRLLDGREWNQYPTKEPVRA